MIFTSKTTVDTAVRTGASDRQLPRRRVLIAGAVAGAVAPFATTLPLGAQALDPIPVTPNPIKTTITKSGLTVNLAYFCKVPASSSTPPYAMVNFVSHAGDGSGRLFAVDSRGKVWQINLQTRAIKIFLDLLNLRGSVRFYDGSPKHLGTRSIAFHPDFARSGRPGFRRFYTVTTESVSSAPATTVIVGSTQLPQSHHDVIAEWQVDAAGVVVPSSYREVLRVRQYSNSHCTDQLLFNPNLAPVQTGYGAMFIGIGDSINLGTNTDPYNQVQNPASPLGKLLRIDPLPSGSKPYGIPAGNPFAGNSSYLPEIWALGVRHPQNLCFDRTTGTLIFTDIGQSQIEEVNFGIPGANYGWPVREGTFVTDRHDYTKLYALPADDASMGFTYPVAQYDHGEGAAITGGFVYRGSAVPALAGQYIFGDIYNGRVFHVPMASLKLGSQAKIFELTLRRKGVTATMREILQTTGRVDLRIGQDEAGELYLSSKRDGILRKLLA